jgi:hypothetical protein
MLQGGSAENDGTPNGMALPNFCRLVGLENGGRARLLPSAGAIISTLWSERHIGCLIGVVSEWLLYWFALPLAHANAFARATKVELDVHLSRE